ncbi:MAG: helix-turn-helix domain-containing protein, partial [Actinomycetota bacterium]|nr:helix-turn-helix domain-containing protein [Actinomycetota bacterium]
MSSEDSNSSLSGSKIGQILKQARKEQGLSLQEVEQATKIRARYLKELEEGNFSVLPAVYVRGSL